MVTLTLTAIVFGFTAESSRICRKIEEGHKNPGHIRRGRATKPCFNVQGTIKLLALGLIICLKRCENRQHYQLQIMYLEL
jgi:hypothetical protein